MAQDAPAAVEDRRAEAGSTILSFSSATHPERHVWIDTDLDGSLVIDLEDWNDETTWDSSVAHLTAPDEKVSGIVQGWLTGATIPECVGLGGHQLFFSLEEAADHVIKQLSPAGRERLRSLNSEGELQTETMRTHHGLGRWIRNDCGLWSNKHLLRSIADSRMQEIRQHLAEGKTLTTEKRGFLESELGYLEKCRQEDFFDPDYFSGVVLHEAWKRLKCPDRGKEE